MFILRGYGEGVSVENAIGSEGMNTTIPPTILRKQKLERNMNTRKERDLLER